MSPALIFDCDGVLADTERVVSKGRSNMGLADQ